MDRTEDHPGPARLQTARGREVLLVAFPESRALPVPVAGEPLGRDWLAKWEAPDTRVSTQHAAFSRAGGALAIEDLGSRNGTHVNGVRIAPRERVPLEDGSRIRVGRTILIYRETFLGDDAPSPPLGALVGPFGLREVASTLEGIRHRPTTNILIEGETGTGKELLAAAVAHALGREHPYTAVNVAGVPAGVFESQLFGYVPGAYSGGGKGSPGLLLAHDKGAVFLDEIGELPLELQPKLLRFLETRDILAVGATRRTRADVLIIAATLRPLEELAREGKFRADLLARFGGRLELPALRDRPEDLFSIMQALAARRNERYDPTHVEVEAIERLMAHDWQRNVRELAMILDRVATIEAAPKLPAAAVERVLGPLPASVRAPLTSDAVRQALDSCGGNESAAARKLGITRGKLRRFLSR